MLVGLPSKRIGRIRRRFRGGLPGVCWPAASKVPKEENVLSLMNFVTFPASRGARERGVCLLSCFREMRRNELLLSKFQAVVLTCCRLERWRIHT